MSGAEILPRGNELDEVLARVNTFAIDGIDVRPVIVELHIRPGPSAFTVVGLAGATIREARQRVRSAVSMSGFAFPETSITANLAPASTRKIGSGLDLPLACAVLAADGQIPADRLERCIMFGELALDGRVRACPGTLAVAEATRRAGKELLIIGTERAHEAALIENIQIAAVATLYDAAQVLRGEPIAPLPVRKRGVGSNAAAEIPLELADVRGQPAAVEALVIAAAGGHNLLMSGPPGTGKTMLAQRLAGILPPMSREEEIEVTRIQSIGGQLEDVQLVQRRPFRAPHHTITTAGLIGNAKPGRLGEIVLAHRGVLFLDELAEFPRGALEALRQPIEEHRVTVVRAQYATSYPARFMLVAATNPCPCGLAGESRCRCSPQAIARYQRRLSGPLLDRIDLLAAVRRPTLAAGPTLTTAEARVSVADARERQTARFAGTEIATNADMQVGHLAEYARLEQRAEEVLQAAYDRGVMSARGHDRVLRVARTVADLEQRDSVSSDDVLKALSLRHDTARHAGHGPRSPRRSPI